MVVQTAPLQVATISRTTSGSLRLMDHLWYHPAHLIYVMIVRERVCRYGLRTFYTSGRPKLTVLLSRASADHEHKSLSVVLRSLEPVNSFLQHGGFFFLANETNSMQHVLSCVLVAHLQVVLLQHQ